MASGILDQRLGCTGLAFMCIAIKDSISTLGSHFYMESSKPSATQEVSQLNKFMKPKVTYDRGAIDLDLGNIWIRIQFCRLPLVHMAASKFTENFITSKATSKFNISEIKTKSPRI
jgi:hypothetical protein